jgi:hypothetical protein
MVDLSPLASRFSRLADELPSSRGEQATALRAALRSWSAEAGRVILEAAPRTPLREDVPRTWFEIARTQEALTEAQNQAAEVLHVDENDVYPAAIQDAYTTEWARAIASRLRALSRERVRVGASRDASDAGNVADGVAEGDTGDVADASELLKRLAPSGKAARTLHATSSDWKRFVWRIDEDVRFLLHGNEITPRSGCRPEVVRYLRALASQPRFMAYEHPGIVISRCSPPLDVFALIFGMAHAQQLRERDSGGGSEGISIQSFVNRHVFLEYLRSSKPGATSAIFARLGYWTLRASARVAFDVSSDYVRAPQDLTELAIQFATSCEATKIEEPLAARVSKNGAEDVRPASSMSAVRDASGAAAGPSQAQHSDDFSTVDWYGTRYVFTRRQQAEVVALLWGTKELPFPALRVGTIRDHLESVADVFRLGEVFRDASKRTKHPAWGTMIQAVAHGVYQLVAPAPRETIDPSPRSLAGPAREANRMKKRRGKRR